MNSAKKLILIVLILGLSGCAGLKDVPKSIWGSSTRVLEEARSNAISKTYDKGYWDCVRTAIDVLNEKGYVIFKKDEVRGVFIIMGIPGSVNTTEVGMFFVELDDHQTRIELASLSTNAKRLLSKPFFHAMDIAFGLAPPDKVLLVSKQKILDLGIKGADVYRYLIEKGCIEEINLLEAQIKKDPVFIKDDLRLKFPDEFDQIFSIFEKVKHPVIEVKPLTDQKS